MNPRDELLGLGIWILIVACCLIFWIGVVTVADWIYAAIA